MPFTTDSIPNLASKTILITGANSGLGFESAKALAAKGAHVIMAVRNLDKGKAAREEILAEQPLASIELCALDLTRLSSIRSCAESVRSKHKQLHVLLNNAGIMATPPMKTEDGFELQFGVNHLGHFALTGLLFPLLTACQGARVVNISSMAHVLGKMRFDDLAWQRGYSKWPAYGMSKLANLLFTYELKRRVLEKGLPILSVAAHPGYAATNLQYQGAQLAGHGVRVQLMRVLNTMAAQSPAMGALPQLYAATAPDVEPGDFIGPSGPFAARGYPAKTQSNKRSHDPHAMRELWERSEALTGVKFPGL